MYQTIFRRYEKKYLLSQEQYENFLKILTYNTVPDEYGKSTVCNIYYDTPDYRLIRASIEKPVYKEKLRLRTYGVPDSSGSCFLELKKKYRGIVYKRRIKAPYIEGFSYLNGFTDRVDGSQIKNEIAYFRNFYSSLVPAMNIFYDRTAYYDRTDSNIRFTFDSKIIYRTYDTDLRSGIYGKRIFDDDIYLLEIKTANSIPIWVSEMLSELKIFPVSFSKYRTAYINTLKNGDDNCA